MSPMARSSHVMRELRLTFRAGANIACLQGRNHIVDVHARLSKANAAATKHAEEESEDAPEWADHEVDEDTNGDGGTIATCYIRENERDHFVVEVIKMELKGASDANRSVPKAGKAIPPSKPDALAGLNVVFTGTFNMDRETCVASAKKCGAMVQAAPTRDTDYVFLGAQAGLKKIQIIEEHGLETVDENGFLSMLKNGVPQEEHGRMAADEERPSKKQKT